MATLATASGFPYPATSETPDVQRDLKALADYLEAKTGPWTTWTPALTAATTNPTTGTGASIVGRYMQIGKTVHGWGYIGFGTAGTAAGSGNYRVSLPVANDGNGNSWMGLGRVKCAGLYTPVKLAFQTTTTCQLEYLSAAVNGTLSAAANAAPGAWTINDYLWYQFTYAAA